MPLRGEPVQDARRRRKTKTRETNILTEVFEYQPFVVGALVLAAKAAIGSAIPRSMVKDEAVTIFGETREDMDRGGPSGQTAAQAIGEHAIDAADRMMSAAGIATSGPKTSDT